MFSGLVMAQSDVLEVKEYESLLELRLKRPVNFKNLQNGDSIAVDGVCLTLKSFNEESLVFDIGYETLKITGWTKDKLKTKVFNLEASLTFQDKLGGQVLTGHVDGQALVMDTKKQGDNFLLKVKVPEEAVAFILNKGYLALNGVSLTVNAIHKGVVELCLIPETLKRSNLSLIQQGDCLNFELDYMSRPSIHAMQIFYKKIKVLLISSFLIFSIVMASLLSFYLLFKD